MTTVEEIYGRSGFNFGPVKTGEVQALGTFLNPDEGFVYLKIAGFLDTLSVEQAGLLHGIIQKHRFTMLEMSEFGQEAWGKILDAVQSRLVYRVREDAE